MVSSSGNTGDTKVTYPAANSLKVGAAGRNAVGVGSVDGYDKKSGFSTYGNYLEMAAPGEYIYTVWPDNQIGYWSGTSFSTPMVSGAVALAFGELGSGGFGSALGERVGYTATDISNLNIGTLLGYGRLDAAKFIQKVVGF